MICVQCRDAQRNCEEAAGAAASARRDDIIISMLQVIGYVLRPELRVLPLFQPAEAMIRAALQGDGEDVPDHEDDNQM
jgi:hypothetical protein